MGGSIRAVSDSKHKNIPKPQGMSGAPIFVLYDDEPKDELQFFPLVAVGTRYKKPEKALVGTDIEFVLRMITNAV